MARPRRAQRPLPFGRVFIGTALDALRLSPLIVALVAVLMVAPGFAYMLSRVLRGDPLGLVALAALEVAVASLMQGLLLGLAHGSRGSLADRVLLAVRRLPQMLALNLLALATMGVGATLGLLGVTLEQSLLHAESYGRAQELIIWSAIAAGLATPILFLARWALATPLMVAEDASLVDAMLRSAALVRGRLWRVAALQTLAPAASIGALILAMQVRTEASGVPAGPLVWLTALGVIAAVQSLGGGRLLQALNSLEGTMGAADLAEVFE